MSPRAGWQTVTFATPVAITANTDYIVSYRTTTGYYSVTPGTSLAAASAVAADRGRRTPERTTTPTPSPAPGRRRDYLVDVVFTKPADPLSGRQRRRLPTAPSKSTRTTPISITVSAPLASGYSVTVSPAAPPSPERRRSSSDGTTLTFTPSAALPGRRDRTGDALRGDVSTRGATLATQSWSFATKAPDDDVLHPVRHRDARGRRMRVTTLPRSSSERRSPRPRTAPSPPSGSSRARQPRHPHRIDLVVDRDEARIRHLHRMRPRRAGRPLAEHTADGDGGPDLRGLVLRADRELLLHGRTTSRSEDQRSADRPVRIERAVPLRRHRRIPEVLVQRDELLRRRGVHSDGDGHRRLRRPRRRPGCRSSPSTATPANPAWQDGTPVQLGVRFTASVAGSITGIRFYKGAGDTGTHTAYLWSATGTQLATGDVHGRDGERLAGRVLHHTGGDHRRHGVPGQLLHDRSDLRDRSRTH